MSFIEGYDSETLREIVDADKCRIRLDEIGEQRSLPALLERVWLLKVLGEVDEARRLSEQSVLAARMAGTRRDQLRARILHATVLQAGGAFAAAEQELSACLEEAEGHGWTGIAAFAVHHRGRVHYDAGDLDEARRDLKRTLFLRQESGASEAELGAVLLAMDAVDRRRARTSVAS